MNAIGILEQQQANEVLRLEIAYSNLYKAYMLGDRNKITTVQRNFLRHDLN